MSLGGVSASRGIHQTNSINHAERSRCQHFRSEHTYHNKAYVFRSDPVGLDLYIRPRGATTPSVSAVELGECAPLSLSNYSHGEDTGDWGAFESREPAQDMVTCSATRSGADEPQHHTDWLISLALTIRQQLGH